MKSRKWKSFKRTGTNGESGYRREQMTRIAWGEEHSSTMSRRTTGKNALTCWKIYWGKRWKLLIISESFWMFSFGLWRNSEKKVGRSSKNESSILPLFILMSNLSFRRILCWFFIKCCKYSSCKFFILSIKYLWKRTCWYLSKQTVNKRLIQFSIK